MQTKTISTLLTLVLTLAIVLVLVISRTAQAADDGAAAQEPPDSAPTTMESYHQDNSLVPESPSAKKSEAAQAANTEIDPQERKQYARDVQIAMGHWEHRVALLRTRAKTDARGEQIDQLANFLQQMVGAAGADLKELNHVKKATWLDVQARLKARFTKMDKEYQVMMAE